LTISVSPANHHFTNFSIIKMTRDSHNKPIGGRSGEWTQLDTPHYTNKKKMNSVAAVRKRTIPTERPPPFSEVSAKLLLVNGVAWSAQRILTAVNLGFLDRTRYFFIQVAP
jgi:hypothetical protein